MDIQRDFDLKTYNTFGVSAKASLCTVISKEEDLQEVIAENARISKELFPLGGGSNLLLSKDLDKWVLINELKGIRVLEEDAERVVVEVMAGENWHQFVMTCLENGWYGLENLSLIPGSVGASPIQNIGAYGVEVKDFIRSVKAIDLKGGEELEFNNASMRFSYRNSIFKEELRGKTFITRVVFELKKKPEVHVAYRALQEELDKRGITDPGPADVSSAVIAVRQSKLPDPEEIGNSGSFFKNPVVAMEQYLQLASEHPDIPNYPVDDAHKKLAAGWLIEQAGWKGFRDGDIGVHAKQALVLVNYGAGKGADIYSLSQRIIDDVKSKFGVELEREVNVF